MRPDIESEITGANELPVKAPGPPPLQWVCPVDQRGPGDAVGFEQGVHDVTGKNSCVEFHHNINDTCGGLVQNL
jgi:hypothetical protein